MQAPVSSSPKGLGARAPELLAEPSHGGQNVAPKGHVGADEVADLGPLEHALVRAAENPVELCGEPAGSRALPERSDESPHPEHAVRRVAGHQLLEPRLRCDRVIVEERDDSPVASSSPVLRAPESPAGCVLAATVRSGKASHARASSSRLWSMTRIDCDGGSVCERTESTAATKSLQRSNVYAQMITVMLVPCVRTVCPPVNWSRSTPASYADAPSVRSARPPVRTPG